MGASRSQPDPDRTPDRLFEEAVNFAVRLQGDPLNPVVLEALREWRARGPDERRIWAEIAEIHGMAGQVLARGQGPGLGRRAFLWGGLGLGGLTLLHKGPGWMQGLRADHLTGKGEIASITLAGARLTLGPASALALDGESPVRLLAGMLYCEAGEAPPALRCGGIEIWPEAGAALGLTAESSEQVLALETGRAHARAEAMERRLAPGDFLRISGGIAEFGQQESGHAAAWRENRLIVEGERLDALVGRIGRWLPGELVLADPWLGRQRVSGVFDLSDPARALEAAVAPLGGRMRRAGDWLTVVSRV